MAEQDDIETNNIMECDEQDKENIDPKQQKLQCYKASQEWFEKLVAASFFFY